MRGEIFGDELPGEAGGAIDNDVEFRRGHIFNPWGLSGFLSLQAKQSIAPRRKMDCFVASLPAMTILFVQVYFFT